MFINVQEWFYLVSAIFTGVTISMLVGMILLLLVGSNKRCVRFFTKKILQSCDLDIEAAEEDN